MTGHTPIPVSVHVLTWNSAATLRRALESVRGCAEILLIDGGSTDNTLAIGHEFGAKVISQSDAGRTGPIMDFAAVRNRGLSASSQAWILVLDSDEIASEELMQDIGEICASGTPGAFLVPRLYVLPDGRIVRHASTYPNERIYFFHRDAVTGWTKPVHERVELRPGITPRRLKGACLAPLPSIAEYKGKNRRYLAIEAARSQNRSVGHWFRHRLLHTLRSRLIGLVRLAWIWLIPRAGARLPLRHELLRFWYGFRLIVDTFPRRQ